MTHIHHVLMESTSTCSTAPQPKTLHQVELCAFLTTVILSGDWHSSNGAQKNLQTRASCGCEPYYSHSSIEHPSKRSATHCFNDESKEIPETQEFPEPWGKPCRTEWEW